MEESGPASDLESPYSLLSQSDRFCRTTFWLSHGAKQLDSHGQKRFRQAKTVSCGP